MLLFGYMESNVCTCIPFLMLQCCIRTCTYIYMHTHGDAAVQQLESISRLSILLTCFQEAPFSALGPETSLGTKQQVLLLTTCDVGLCASSGSFRRLCHI